MLVVFALVLGASVAGAADVDPFSSADRAYWAFQPLREVSPPASSGEHPLDSFVKLRLASKGLELAERADRITLIRRASFDLIGLPPTPEEVARFVHDDSPEAWPHLIDRLLDSPHYGERWGRHWLDLARYAESNGFKTDETRPNAWRYRDYVVESLNEDKPYDRFVAEQIAGDELWPADSAARIATGFNRNYPDESNAANLQQRRAELLQDVTDAVGSTFLGLTFGCAKCHDHKFDPILQKDYYRLQAFFAGSAEDDQVPVWSEAERADYNRRLAVWEEATAEIRAEMDALIEPERQKRLDFLHSKRTEFTKSALDTEPDELTPAQRQMLHKHYWQFGYDNDKHWKRLRGEPRERYKTLQARLDEFDHLHPGEAPVGMGLRDLGVEAPPTHVLGLANYAVPKEEVEPGFLSILDPGPADYRPIPELSTSGRRTALAQWMIDPENPLTSRVMVNRLWHHHFGRGIVASPSDFGRMGERPTHPELLDYLARRFMEDGWSLKRMHRLIMTSEAYQQSSSFNEPASKKDPFNKLLWRFRPQRLEGEVIRDSMLAVSGALNAKLGGPSVMPPLPEGMPEKRLGWVTDDDPEERRRRSLYVFIRRNHRYPMMQAFDMPDTHASCARRDVTTTAPQALALLNDEQTIDWAAEFAARVLHQAGADPSAQVREAFLLAYSREPDSGEKDSALTFLAEQRERADARKSAGYRIAPPADLPEQMDAPAGAALTDLCHALMNSNEFVYRY